MVAQSAKAIEQADRSLHPARIRYTEVLEPRNVRQCWSSYPYVDDQRIPVLEAVDVHSRAIVTLASVSQHMETTGFNDGTPTLDVQNRWVSSDWAHFFRASLEQRLGGVAIEMAGSVGSVESPEVYNQPISRTPQQFVDAKHPAGCRTLFRVGSGTDAAGTEHVPVGYFGETRAFGQTLAAPIITALKTGAYHYSASNLLWGARATICVPLGNALFGLGASLGVFAASPVTTQTARRRTRSRPTAPAPVRRCARASPRSASATASSSRCPARCSRSRSSAASSVRRTCPIRRPALPPWLIPHMHAPIPLLRRAR